MSIYARQEPVLGSFIASNHNSEMNWWVWRGGLVCQDKMVAFSDNQGDNIALNESVPGRKHRGFQWVREFN